LLGLEYFWDTEYSGDILSDRMEDGMPTYVLVVWFAAGNFLTFPTFESAYNCWAWGTALQRDDANIVKFACIGPRLSEREKAEAICAEGPGPGCD
jgi:hypothetical protein